MNNWLSTVIVFIGAAGYGVLATLVKIGYSQGYSVGEITGSQMFIGVIALWLIGLTQLKKWTKIPVKSLIALIGLGTLTGLTGIFYYTSLQYLPASIAIVLLFQFTWIGVLYEWLISRKKPTVQTLISLGMIMVGTLLAANVFYDGISQFSLFGILMGLISAFTYAGFIFASGRIVPEVSPWLRSPLMITGSFLITILIFPPVFLTSGVLVNGLFGLAVALAFFGAILPTICFTFGVPKIGVGKATILSSVELPVAVLLAWLVFLETVYIMQWLGILLIMIAILFDKVEKPFDIVNKRWYTKTKY